MLCRNGRQGGLSHPRNAMIAIVFTVLLLLALVSAVSVVLLVRWLLTGSGAGDDALTFDPHQRLPPSRGPWVWNYLISRFGGQRRLSYRRDRQGRFRKRDR